VPPPDGRTVIVCGSDRTTLRVVSDLVDSGERVVAIVSPDSPHLERMSELGAHLIAVRALTESVLRRAGVDADASNPSTARALVLMNDTDVRNVHAALIARDLDRKLKIVVLMVNPRLGQQMRSLLGDCMVVSGPSLAAPAFVAEALDEDELTWVEIGGRRVVAGPADRITEPHVLVLADITSSATPELLPSSSDDPAGDIVLGSRLRRLPRRPRDARRAGWIVALRNVVDRRVRLIAAIMAVLIGFGTLVTHYYGSGLGWVEALYLAAGTVTTAGVEDDAFVAAPAWAKLGAVGAQLGGIVLVALLTAVIVDSLIGARLSQVLGGVRGRPRNHVVVCGLGTVGARVLELLADRGIAVIGIDHNEDAPGVRTAHRLRVPVIIGDSSHVEVLRSAGIERCRAMLAITDGDITNLDTAMAVRDLNPEARITMRMFDGDLAIRVEGRLALGTSKSVSMLVGPAVVAALSSRRMQVTVSAGRRVLLLTEVTVEAGAAAVGSRLGDLVESGGLRVLAHQPPNQEWSWPADAGMTVRAGSTIAVAATRSGLARFLLATRAPRPTELSERMDP
jgi:Trk K+ transport system NAD-binding subunit